MTEKQELHKWKPTECISLFKRFSTIPSGRCLWMTHDYSRALIGREKFPQVGCVYIANQLASLGSVWARASTRASLGGRSRGSAIVQLSLTVMEESSSWRFLYPSLFYAVLRTAIDPLSHSAFHQLWRAWLAVRKMKFIIGIGGWVCESACSIQAACFFHYLTETQSSTRHIRPNTIETVVTVKQRRLSLITTVNKRSEIIWFSLGREVLLW